MYHPVEEAAFNANGSPLIDLYEDVHEFVEIYNLSSNTVALTGWKLAGGIDFTFPTNEVISPGQFRVIAKNPARLAAVSAYGLSASSLFGPYDGQLGNGNDSVRLKDSSGDVVDAVSYSAEFPWAISADALGADQEWTGLNPVNYQYRGRSLERVSFTWPATDPANWLASSLPGNPSPGKTNAVSRPIPKPVIVSFNVAQAADEASIIRSNQPVRIDCAFSATNALSTVRVEWFIDDINVTKEPTLTNSMSISGPAEDGRFTVVLPGQPDRSIVRFRFRADRGTGDEIVSPRADDAFQWHAYFVTPVRVSTKPIYDCLISSNSLTVLNANISQSPRRITTPDPPGTPRASWNATEPAVMVHNGVVYDIRMRHHGSRYNRNPGRNSFKWQFPRFKKFQGTDSIFETDKGNDFVVGQGLFVAGGFPVSNVRYVDLYLNNNGPMQRLEQGEFNIDLLDAFHKSQQDLNPGTPLEASGEIYKSVGTIEVNGEGPYGRGDGRKLSKLPYWTDLQMYDWTYSLQSHGWRGSFYFKTMVDAMWAARGDNPSAPNPNIPALRSFFTNYFDIDEMLSYIAVENWCCPWDDTTQNHFLWQRRNGKWGMLPWDCDAWFGNGDNTPAASSIYIGEVGDTNNNSRGPNFFKDGFIKAFRQEYKQRMYLLNNTFLHPDNIVAMGFGSISGFANARFAAVNAQCGFGPFQRPNKPVNLAPPGGGTALPPMSLQASAYTYSTNPPLAHAKTTWEIRSTTGTYRAPLWKLTSATNLTSIPIPFELLNFGATYYWRCTYFDANGHPSLPSDETSFTFGPLPSQVTLIAIDGATQWKYNQTADLSNTNWISPAYDDSAWPSGAGILAVENCGCLPEPIRTTLTLGRNTYYFRKHFNFPGNPQGATLKMRQVIDDGCVVYLNGVEISRTRMPAGAVNYATFASATVSDGVYEGPIALPTGSLVQGDNVIAVEVHQPPASSSDITFGLSLDGTVSAVAGDLVLNEIAADNDGSPDWIELFNNSNQTINLTGASLSDDVLVPGKYVFPANTLIAARGYLTIWCDDDTNAPGLHTGFGLNKRGQTVALFTPTTNGIIVGDYITFGLQLQDFSIGRVTNGTGPWQLNVPTPGAQNVAKTLGSPANLKINEWMASPASGDDWFEIYNTDALPVMLSGLYLTDTLLEPTNSRVAPLTFIEAGGFAKFFADSNPENGADHVSFRLSANGESIGLFSTNGTTAIDAVTFGPQTSGVSEGRLPDGAAAIVAFPATPSPEQPNHLPISDVIISEVLSHTDPPLEDAIELQNVSTNSVPISGWFLSDDLKPLKKFQIPDETIIPPGGFKVFYEHDFNANTNSPASFALSSARGDDVYLSVADSFGNLTGYRTHVDFGPAENGVSIGRYLKSDGVDFTALSQRTLGASNAYPKVGPVVISEIMYHPPDLGTNDNARDEFIELHNITGAPVPLFDPAHPANTWRLRSAVYFDFPTNVSIGPLGYLLVVSFDPATNSAALGPFQLKYGSNAVLFGPYNGKLDNSSDGVELRKPDAPETAPGPDFGLVPYILVDKVNYSDAPPWPFAADGSGPSLQRLSVTGYGNDSTNWFASGFTPGRSYFSNQPPTVTITSPTNAATFIWSDDIAIIANASDPDGAIAKVEFYASTLKLDETANSPYSFIWTNAQPGNYSITARAIDNEGAVTISTPITIAVNDSDVDHDSMPDSWEAAHGLIVGLNDAAADPDADGLTNLQEYQAGTDPQNAGSVLKLNATRTGNTLLLQFAAMPNHTYTIEHRDNIFTGPWQTLTNIPATPSGRVIMTSNTVDTAQRVYRVFIP